MSILGAHMSIAGGYYKAVDAAAEVGFNCVQLFCKNNNQWRAKEITPKECERFQETLSQHGITHPLCHSSYLINLASAKQELWEKSLQALIVELLRCDQLQIPYLVMHPGAFVDDTLEGGISRIAQALNQIHDEHPDIQCQVLLETTAGQGSCIGHRFEHLADILAQLETPDRVQVCLDTCHIFAAGYPLDTEEEYHASFAEFDNLVGLKKLKAIHLNDSKKPLGSRVDRHEHIGQGHIGENAFRHLLCDPRMAEIPMYLETPKGEEEGVQHDTRNLETLRRLAKSS
ncbi:MAG: deoxyribonuclease IV [Pirellulaceae bacterium]